jgi:hypothetical protein
MKKKNNLSEELDSIQNAIELKFDRLDNLLSNLSIEQKVRWPFTSEPEPDWFQPKKKKRIAALELQIDEEMAQLRRIFE